MTGLRIACRPKVLIRDSFSCALNVSEALRGISRDPIGTGRGRLGGLFRFVWPVCWSGWTTLAQMLLTGVCGSLVGLCLKPMPAEFNAIM